MTPDSHNQVKTTQLADQGDDVENNTITKAKVDEDGNDDNYFGAEMNEMFRPARKSRIAEKNNEKRRLSSSALTQRSRQSSIANRVNLANNSTDGIEQNLWGVAATIFTALLFVHGMSYVIVEYGFFGGMSEYPKMDVVSSEYSSSEKNDLGMSGKGPAAGFTEYQFQLFLGFVMYANVVLTGLGLEYFVWRSVLNDVWDERKENVWRVAQFLFPILVGTSVGLSIEGNFLCLPLLALSMWKLGFPETLMLIYSALYNKDNSFVQRLIDMIRGVGTIVHHSSSTLFVTMLLFQILPPTQKLLSILPPLLMQHWFVLLKYNYHWLYVCIATILEVWFEWETFSNLEAYHEVHWIGGIALFSLLIAHWAYYGAGIIGIICLRDKDDLMTEKMDNVYRLHTMQSKRCLVDDEFLSLNVNDDVETEDSPEKSSAGGTCFSFRRYSAPILIGVTCVGAAVAVSVPLALSASSSAKGNDLCPKYCELYAKAAESCPYYVSYYVPEASHLESREECIPECEAAQFSKTHSDMTFDTDSLQCRMNHARMAIKEGALTNSMHCVHATISGTQRCRQDQVSIKMQKQIELGKEIFYTPSDWLAPDNPKGISEFQALMASISFMVALRGRLYISYPGDDQHQQDKLKFDCASTDIRFRSADGSCNSISQPAMGKVGTSFNRNLKPSEPHKNGEADVALVANIMKRDTNSFAPFNQLASAWIQFMTHDWFQHDASSSQGLKMKNVVTHWWDASQMYGSSQEEVDAVRAEGGKLHLDVNDEIDYNASLPITGFRENWWAGLHILHTIFAREHNHIVDILAQSYPSMTEDELFGTARNIIAVLLAKIHTVEWTPTLLDNAVSDMALNINWHGLQTVTSMYFKGKNIPDEVKDIIDEMKVPSVFGSNYTTEQTLFNTPFYMTEEFVSVYRMHTLLPDAMILEGGKTVSLQELAFTDARNLVSDPSKTTATLLQAFAHTPAQALSLKNYPKSLFNLQIGNGKSINLAEIDISRDRARGIPRYNDARRQLLLTPYKSMDDLTSDKEELKLLKSVYTDIEQVDFLVGCLVDKDRPDGFAFGIVPYYIFVVMASRRLLSDRFFQEGLTEENYSEIGVRYLMETNFHDILARQFPNMKNTIPRNPFSNDWEFELF